MQVSTNSHDARNVVAMLARRQFRVPKQNPKDERRRYIGDERFVRISGVDHGGPSAPDKVGRNLAFKERKGARGEP